MLWLIIAILSYLLLAVVSLVDKYLLKSAFLNPGSYAFYGGTLGGLILIIIPFVGFYIPQPKEIIIALLSGALFVCALFWLYKGLKDYEPSRIIPAIGGLIPLFTFGLIFLFGEQVFLYKQIIAFFLLVFGSVFITIKNFREISFKSLRISAVAALFFSLFFVLSKYTYTYIGFWPGFMWIKIGGLIMAFCFLFLGKEVKQEIFGSFRSFKERDRMFGVLLLNEVTGGGANILQSWAIFLAPLTCVAIVNALQGIQYIFLLVLIVILSFFFPFWSKKIGIIEEISPKVIFQKIFAILLIGAGLWLLTF